LFLVVATDIDDVDTRGAAGLLSNLWGPTWGCTEETSLTSLVVNVGLTAAKLPSGRTRVCSTGERAMAAACCCRSWCWRSSKRLLGTGTLAEPPMGTTICGGALTNLLTSDLTSGL